MNSKYRPGELVMGQHVRTHQPRTNLNTLIHSFRPEPPAFLPTAVLLQLKQFPDVSFWQGEIDWDVMASKTDTVIIRAGQNIWPDIQFKRNYSEAKKRRMRRGVYWFYDDRMDPGKQAALLVSFIKDDPPEMKVYVDRETKFGGPFGGLRNVVAFMQTVETALPVEAGMYTGYWFFRENSNAITSVAQYSYLKAKELWEAFYAPASSVLVPAPWPVLTHWQHGTPAVGKEHGAKTEDLDMNYANMPIAEFEQRYPIAVSVPPVEPDPPPIVVVPPVVVVPPTRPVITPETDLWIATVRPVSKMIVRTYPLVAYDTRTPDYVYGGEIFKGQLWSGNNFVWIWIETSTRATLIGKWVAVRSTDGTSNFIKLEKPPVVPGATPVSLYRVRQWGDPVLVREGGLSVDIVGTSNFQAVGLYNKLTGWGGVSNHLTIPRSDINKLMALQVEDEYQDKQPDWRKQKMNWLCKPRGTIYFTKDGPNWETAVDIMWGTIALGHNLVQVDGLEDMVLATPNDPKARMRKMARLAGFRKADWVRPLIELVARGLVHRCYCAYSGDDIGDSPKGIVYSPFWSPLDWDFAGNARPQAFYLPVDWLLPV